MQAVATPALSVDRSGAATLPVQVASQLRGHVVAGVLGVGDRLPSSRALATDLGVSRSVTEQAYDQLVAEGWLEARRGAGTFVAAPSSRRQPSPAAVPPSRPVPAMGSGRRPPLVRLGTGAPWVDPRQAAGWRRAWRSVASSPTPRDYPDAAGDPELRESVAAYVGRTRGLDCSPEQVLVTLGTTDGLRHLLDALAPGPVAVEDPGYRAAVAVASRAGRAVLDVPVDDEGLDVTALRRLPRDVRAVYVTPAHQHPTGATMSATRRVDLLEECRDRGALVVEDDYDSEFRYDVAPLPALAALDGRRVVHLGTASKSVSPGLRLGWLVGPDALVSELAERRAHCHDVPSWPVQRAWLSMLREGHVDRLVRSARRVYAARGRLIAERLAAHLPPERPVAGMYVALELPADVASRARAACARAGYELPMLAETARSSRRTGLVLGFGGLSDAQLDEVLDVLVPVLDAGRAGASAASAQEEPEA